MVAPRFFRIASILYPSGCPRWTLVSRPHPQAIVHYLVGYPNFMFSLTDIAKEDRGAMHIDRPQTSAPTSRTPTTASRSPELLTPANQEPAEPFGSYTEPLSEGEEDEVMDVAPVKDEAQHMNLPSAQVNEAIKYRQEALQRKQKEKAPSNGADNNGDDPRQPYLRRHSSAAAAMVGHPDNLAIDPLALASQFDKSFRSKLSGVQGKEQTNGKAAKQAVIHDTIAEDVDGEDSAAADDEHADGEGNEDENRTVLVQSFHAQPGKRIAVPVRVEPKVIFANERTFMVRSMVIRHCHRVIP